MSTIDEKRVYSDRSGAIDAYVASETGLVHVSVADDTVGEFELRERCHAQDIAAGPSTVAVATETDVLVATDTPDTDEPAFVETGFGPAVAVGIAVDADTQTVIAAGPDGQVARYHDHEDTWERVEYSETEDSDIDVRAIDGTLVGTTNGVYRILDQELVHAGLSRVRDVSASGVPLAATADGLYKLGNGWLAEVDRAVDVVTADPLTSPGHLERAHAVAETETTVLEHDDGEWVQSPAPPAPVVDIAYGTRPYAVTANGQFLAQTADGWRSRHLGIGDVAGVAIPSEQ